MVYKSVLQINHSYTYIKRKERKIENILNRFSKAEKEVNLKEPPKRFM